MLVQEDTPQPLASIWIGSEPEEAKGLSFTNIKREIQAAAPSVLSAEEMKRLLDPLPDEDYALGFAVSKKTLLDGIFDSDGQQFCDGLVAHLEILAKFIPKLDELLVQAPVKPRM